MRREKGEKRERKGKVFLLFWTNKTTQFKIKVIKNRVLLAWSAHAAFFFVSFTLLAKQARLVHFFTLETAVSKLVVGRVKPPLFLLIFAFDCTFPGGTKTGGKVHGEVHATSGVPCMYMKKGGECV